MSCASDIARFVALGWTAAQIAEVCEVSIARVLLHPDLVPLSPAEREIARLLLDEPPLSASELRIWRAQERADARKPL